MEAVGQLTGGIAHDFNNMLAVIMGGLNLLQRKLARGETDVERFVEGAIDGAQRAATLTQRLLAFSRQQPLSPEPLIINKLVAGMSELLDRTLGEQVKVETVLAAGLWQVKADPAQLENAILNLAVNARDAMPGGGRLTIETLNAFVDDAYAQEYAIEAGQYVLIAVADTGAGMAPEVIAKAFDPFFTTKGAGKGTGLGLSQVYGFVRQSGGHVKIYSELGVGTSVKIYLPRLYGEAAATEQAKRLATHPPRSAQRGHPRCRGRGACARAVCRSPEGAWLRRRRGLWSVAGVAHARRGPAGHAACLPTSSCRTCRDDNWPIARAANGQTSRCSTRPAIRATPSCTTGCSIPAPIS